MFPEDNIADLEQRTKMANSLKKDLEETFKDSLIFPKGKVPGPSFRIKGFYPEEMIASEKVLFDELSVAYLENGLETVPRLKGKLTYPEDLGYMSTIIVHEDEEECKEHIHNVLKYVAEATLKCEFKNTSEMQKTLICTLQNMLNTPLEHGGKLGQIDKMIQEVEESFLQLIKYDDILHKSLSKVQDKLDTLKANGKLEETTEKMTEKVKNDQNERSSHIRTQLFTSIIEKISYWKLLKLKRQMFYILS